MHPVSSFQVRNPDLKNRFSCAWMQQRLFQRLFLEEQWELEYLMLDLVQFGAKTSIKWPLQTSYADAQHLAPFSILVPSHNNILTSICIKFVGEQKEGWTKTKTFFLISIEFKRRDNILMNKMDNHDNFCSGFYCNSMVIRQAISDRLSIYEGWSMTFWQFKWNFNWNRSIMQVTHSTSITMENSDWFGVGMQNFRYV